MNPGRRRLLLGGAAAALTGSLALALHGRTGAPGSAAAALPPFDDLCIVAPLHPFDAASGLAPHAARAVPADARCPVCGMYPQRYPDWAAQVIYQDGSAHFFDSPLSLFVYLADVPRYCAGYSQADIAARYVTANDLPAHPATDNDGTAGRSWMAADDAWFVHGSAALGPMRNGNLPAFASRAQAEAFARQRGGTVLPFTQVDDALVRTLHTGRHSHR